MGHWHETCALTRMEIAPGEPVILVHWKKSPPIGKLCPEYDPKRSTYELMRDLHKEASTHPEYDNVPYDERPKVWGVMAKYIDVYQGTYDDYGWIEELERPDDLDRKTYFMVHRDVADYACALFEKDAGIEYNYDSGVTYKDLKAVAKAIAFFAYVCRVSLFAEDWHLGDQVATPTEWSYQRQLMMIATGIMANKELEWGGTR